MTRALRLLPLILASALSLPVLAQNTPPDVSVPDNQQALIERLLRLYGGQTDSVITFGGLPSTLPITFDPAVTVQATIRSLYPGGIPSYRIFALSTGSLDSVRQALATSLRASGWQPIPTPPIYGFQPTDGLSNTAFFYDGKFPLTLNASVQTTRRQVELEVNVLATTAQRIASLKKSAGGYPRSSMPPLIPVPGATVKTEQANFSSRPGAINSARVQSKLSANEVLAFYSQQLKKAGWLAVTDTRSGELRVVTYLLTDLGGRQAVGVLGIRTQAEGDYILTASVNGFNPI